MGYVAITIAVAVLFWWGHFIMPHAIDCFFDSERE